MSIRGALVRYFDRQMGIRDRRVRFPELRKVLDGADQHLIDQVQSLDTLDQGALDSYSGPALRELAKMQGEAAEIHMDAMWSALTKEIERMKRRHP